VQEYEASAAKLGRRLREHGSSNCWPKAASREDGLRRQKALEKLLKQMEKSS